MSLGGLSPESAVSPRIRYGGPLGTRARRSPPSLEFLVPGVGFRQLSPQTPCPLRCVSSCQLTSLGLPQPIPDSSKVCDVTLSPRLIGPIANF